MEMHMNDFFDDLEPGIPGWDDELVLNRQRSRFLGRRMRARDFLPRLAQTFTLPLIAFRRIGAERHTIPQLLFWLTLANIAFFTAWAIRLYVVPRPHLLDAYEVPFGLLLMGSLVGRYFFVGWFAAGMCAFMRMIGGKGNNRSCFAALIWADLVTAPISLLLALLSLVFHWLSFVSPIFSFDWFIMPLYWIGLVSIVYYGAMALAAVHRLPPGRVLLVTSLVSLAGLALGLYLLVLLS